MTKNYINDKPKRANNALHDKGDVTATWQIEKRREEGGSLHKPKTLYPNKAVSSAKRYERS
jgi:hypothetical protein